MANPIDSQGPTADVDRTSGERVAMPISYSDFQQRRRNLDALALDRARSLHECVKPVVEDWMALRADPEPITGLPMFTLTIDEGADPGPVEENAPLIARQPCVNAFDGSTLSFAVGTPEKSFPVRGIGDGHDIFTDKRTHKWVSVNGTLRKLDTIAFVTGENSASVYDLLNDFEDAVYSAHLSAEG